MTTPLDHFVTESNVDLYMSKLSEVGSESERDNLLRLLVAEENIMGKSQEHLENGERRAADGRERILRQRDVIAALERDGHSTEIAMFVLESLERAQSLMEAHCSLLRSMLWKTGL